MPSPPHPSPCQPEIWGTRHLPYLLYWYLPPPHSPSLYPTPHRALLTMLFACIEIQYSPWNYQAVMLQHWLNRISQHDSWLTGGLWTSIKNSDWKIVLKDLEFYRGFFFLVRKAPDFRWFRLICSWNTNSLYVWFSTHIIHDCLIGIVAMEYCVVRIGL